MPSIIEDHPQRQMIIDALLAGEATRKIAARCTPPLDDSTVWRYRKNVLGLALRIAHGKLVKQKAANDGPALPTAGDLIANGNEAVRKASAALIADPLISRLSRKQERRDRWLQGAESKEDFRACAAIDRGETSDIELEARLTGRLDGPVQAANHTTIVVFVAPPSSSGTDPETLTIDVQAEK